MNNNGGFNGDSIITVQRTEFCYQLLQRLTVRRDYYGIAEP